jgi:hypothetical protein
VQGWKSPAPANLKRRKGLCRLGNALAARKGGRTMYKVLKRVDGRLLSPFQNYEYEVGKEYVCEDFDSNPENVCSQGLYATSIDGLIYSFRNLPEHCVYECEVSGRKVEIDQFKRRYEKIRLVREVSRKEIKQLALAEEERAGYKLAEALFPVHPLKIKRRNPHSVTKGEIKLLKKWASVGDSVWSSVWSSVEDSVWDSVGASVRDSVGASVGSSVWSSVEDSVWDSVGDSVWDSAWDSVGASVGASVGDSVWAYISSLFPNIKKWEYIEHEEGINPFQPCIDLWHRGLVLSFDGKTWRLHAGEKANIVWEGVIESAST